MKARGAHLGAMFQIAKGGAGSPDQLTAHAHGLHQVSKVVVPAFAQRTDGGKTDSTAEIWDDADGVEAKAADMEEAAAPVVAAVESGDQAAVGRALGAAGDGCKAYHKQYRVKR